MGDIYPHSHSTIMHPMSLERIRIDMFSFNPPYTIWVDLHIKVSYQRLNMSGLED